MLEQKKIKFRFRNYIDEPLSPPEIRAVLRKLQLPARELLRKRDKAYVALGLTGDEQVEELIRAMARFLGLLARPIAIRGNQAIIARPPEKLLPFVTSKENNKQ